jgi:putative membrane protein
MRIGVLALSLALSGAALAQTGSPAQDDKAAGQAAKQSAESQKPTDPQIAHIAATAHQIDIDRGKLALKKSKNSEVKQFAQQMVDDHSAGLKEAVALCKKLGVKPEANPTSKSLMDGAHKATAKLKKESGKKFDKDYIDTEVAYHKAVIDAVKTVLIPNAQNDELKQLLTDAVPTLEGHLKHAENVQSQVGGAASASK